MQKNLRWHIKESKSWKTKVKSFESIVTHDCHFSHIHPYHYPWFVEKHKENALRTTQNVNLDARNTGGLPERSVAEEFYWKQVDKIEWEQTGIFIGSRNLSNLKEDAVGKRRNTCFCCKEFVLETLKTIVVKMSCCLLVSAVYKKQERTPLNQENMLLQETQVMMSNKIFVRIRYRLNRILICLWFPERKHFYHLTVQFKIRGIILGILVVAVKQANENVVWLLFCCSSDVELTTNIYMIQRKMIQMMKHEVNLGN